MRLSFSAAIGMLLGIALGVTGCIGADPPSIKSHDPTRLVPAIKEAVESGDMSAVPYLIADLDSDDPAVRFYSIDGLQRLTKQGDMGYVYYQDETDRLPAIQRWKDWWANHSVGTEQPLASNKG